MSLAIDLSGKRALVTGASQGIGAAIARTLHEAGADVVVNHPDLGEGATRAGRRGRRRLLGMPPAPIRRWPSPPTWPTPMRCAR